MKNKNLHESRARKTSKVGSNTKEDYTNTDFQKIRIIMYLKEHGKARIGEFRKIRKYGITANASRLGVVLEKMIEDNWICRTISSDSKNVKIYTLTEKGHQLKNYVSKLEKDEPNHPLFDLDLFASVRSLD